MYKLITLAMIAAFTFAQTSTSTSATTTTSTSTSTTSTARTAACPADEYCLSCNSTKCTQCIYSYADSNGICQVPTTSITNCRFYSSATVCTACEAGYYVNTAGSACTAIAISNCEYVSSSATSTCLVCANSKLVDSTGKCSGSTDCTLANCDLCLSNTSCAQCNSAYSLVSTTSGSTTTYTCVAEPTANCNAAVVTAATSSAAASTTCSTCDDGYYYSTGAKCTASSVQNNAAIFSVVAALFAFVKLLA